MCRSPRQRCAHKHVWHSYPERGWIQFLILRILYEKPIHGYRLLQELDKRSCGCHRLEAGSIYTLLRRMERRGLLKSEWEKAGVGLGRRVYRVTEAGGNVLKDGLEKIVRKRSLIEDLIAFHEKHFKKR